MERVRRVVAEGGLVLGGSRARDVVVGYLGTYVAAIEFAERVPAMLCADDFCETVELDGDPYDVYGLALSDEFLEQHGLDERAWYVKFTVRTSPSGESVFFLSLHPLERPMDRLGGRLKPGRRES